MQTNLHVSSVQTLAPCIPSKAADIRNPSAQNMLSRLEYTPIPTDLPHGIIHTSHVRAMSNNTQSPAVIFLHGFDSNLLEFRYILPMVETLGYESHFIDVLGWGLTETRIHDNCHFGPLEKRIHLAAVIDNLVSSSRPLIIIGASLGGSAALDFHLAYPHRVAALVLIDAQAFTDRRVHIQPPIWLARVGARVLRATWLRRLAADMSYERQQMRSNDDILRIGGLHCQRSGWEQSTIDFIRRDAYCLSDRVCDVDVPTLVLWGRKDRVMPVGDPNKFVETIPDCELVYIENAGHSPHIEQPQAVMQAIESFVSRRVLTKEDDS